MTGLAPGWLDPSTTTQHSGCWFFLLNITTNTNNYKIQLI